VILKYSLVQVPATVLVVLVLILIQRWVNLPSWLFWAVIAVWVAKDILLYPMVWRSYDSGQQEKTEAMVGARGVAVQRLAPSGYVRVRGELWKAELTGNSAPVNRGKSVKVKGIQGLTLIVQPEHDGGSGDRPDS
jgi:membrane-bound serine protease (ClpP class)